MKKYLFLAVIIFLLPAVSLAQSYILYGAKEKYFNDSSEVSLSRDSIVLDKYSPYNNDLYHQVPLQKYIKSSNYDLFIGLALSDSPESILKTYTADTNYIILNVDTVKIKKVYFYRLFALYNGEFNYKIIFKSKKSYYTAVLNFVSKQKSVIESLYNDPLFFEKKLGRKIKTK